MPLGSHHSSASFENLSLSEAIPAEFIHMVDFIAGEGYAATHVDGLWFGSLTTLK